MSADAPDRGDGRDGALAEKLVAVFMRLARGDLTARLPRTFKQDNEDAIAFFVDVLAEQIGEQNRRERAFADGVAAHLEKFIQLASGDFSVRAERTGHGDALDTMAYLLNNVAGEIGDLVEEHDRQRVLLETILESMLDGVILLDRRGHIRRTNGAMGKLLGRAADDLVGLEIAAVLAPSERGLAERLSSEHAEAAFTSRDTLFRAPGAGDATLSFAVNGSPHRDERGQPAGFVLVARDDRELRKVNAQLHMSDRLATMGTLAAGVAHEINNPLAFVSANIDFVLEELEALARGEQLSAERVADVTRALRSSREGARRVRNIVRDLHHFSRAEAEGAATLDVNALLDTAVGFVQNEIRHHARLVKRYGAPPPVHANEGRLLQVFLNLILNAAQAIPLGAADRNEIVVATGAEDGSAVVEIRDSGGGIATEDLPRIFDLFYTTKPVGEGTGLGLSIALRLVERAGGRIEVESKRGEGSVFRVRLPGAPAERTKSKPPASSKKRAARRMRVLVVDDEAEVGESVRRLLGRAHDVEVAVSAAAAASRLEEREYDVVLCDLLMPEMTGMDLHERLQRTHPKIAERMVFMTAGTFSTSAQAFLTSVKNRRLDKPFDAEALRALLEDAAALR